MAKVVSFSPRKAIEGGLAVNDIDGTLTEVHAENPFTYPNGTLGGCTVVAKFTTTDGDVHPVFWSVGPAKDYEVSENKLQIISKKDNEGVGKQSNFMFMLMELESAGMPAKVVDEATDLSFLEGLKAHWVQKPVPFQGADDGAPKQPGERTKTTAVPNKVHSASWDKGGASGGAAKKPRPGAKAAAAPAADLDMDTVIGVADNVLGALMGAHPGKEFKMAAMWQGATLRAAGEAADYTKLDDAHKQAVLAKLKDKEYLEGYGNAVSATGGVTLATA